jgi:hypothetical protein
MPLTSPRRTRKDRLSISLVPPESLDTAFRCAHLQSLFNDGRSADGNSTTKCDSCEEDLIDSQEKRNKDTIVDEVAKWLELTSEQDNGFGERTRQLRRVCLHPWASVWILVDFPERLR